MEQAGTEVLSRRVANDPEALRAIFAELGGDAKVALKAAFGWEWLADLPDQEGIELDLAPPRHTKAARVDRDARTVQASLDRRDNLVRLGSIREAVPPRQRRFGESGGGRETDRAGCPRCSSGGKFAILMWLPGRPKPRCPACGGEPLHTVKLAFDPRNPG